ncbi:hypothetical protein VNO78_23193 [Psophocarpus tetragonolobus]|uniref:Uncharacterized protein n=1 Tax=Psophocarpus tetragonolobus TaxID=3891 RepID=A0AAN9XDJ3_PSOTE
MYYTIILVTVVRVSRLEAAFLFLCRLAHLLFSCNYPPGITSACLLIRLAMCKLSMNNMCSGHSKVALYC